MNIGIIGCGLTANLHAHAIQSLGYNVKWVIATNQASAKVFSEKWGVNNHAQILSDNILSQLDCIHICTPPAFHYELVKQCLLKGIHVVCEKPLSLSKKEAKELMHLANKNQLINAVNFNNRFYEACEKARLIIQNNDFGKPLLIHGSYQQEFHALPEPYSWRYQSKSAGSLRATSEIGSHLLDLIHYWTDLNVIEVSANLTSFKPVRYLNKGVMLAEDPQDDSEKVYVFSDDAAIISIKFENGAIGNIVLSEISHGRSNSLKLEIVGEKQSVWWDSEKSNCLNTAKKGEGITQSINAFSPNYSNTISELIQLVYSDISSKDSPKAYPTFRDGYLNACLCDAIYESSKNNGAWVSLEVQGHE